MAESVLRIVTASAHVSVTIVTKAGQMKFQVTSRSPYSTEIVEQQIVPVLRDATALAIKMATGLELNP